MIFKSLGIAVLAWLFSQTLLAATQIPALNWEKRSDWVSVQTDVTPAAKGDGIADDTAAIQAALDGVKDGSVLYFPAGTYRITATLRVSSKTRVIGVLFVGHGRDTKIVWDGPGAPGIPEVQSMWVDGVASHSRYVGFTFDGKNKATVGLHHLSTNGGFFKTEVGHRHMAFLNLTDAGILAEAAPATAETMTENCLFENCKRGIAFVAFNDYDFTIDGCEFRRCETAIETRHGNCYVRNCRFEGSTNTDLLLYPEHGSSVRRCTSIGSKMFVNFSNSVAPLTMENCLVSAWTNTEGAVSLGGAPVVMFDCGFINPPGKTQPVRVGGGQPLFLSGNTPADANSLVQNAEKSRLYLIPPGKQKSAITSVNQTFLIDTAAVPTTVFDAKRDFGAKGDGRTDDTDAIQKTIDAAREKSHGAIAYLPTGIYVVKKTLHVTGADYTFGGTGFRAGLLWRGDEGGTIVDVADPQRVTLENLAVGNHDTGQTTNAIDILQTGTDNPSFVTYDNVSVFGMYQKKPFVKGLWLRGLGKEAVVTMPHVQGNIHLVDSARATIVAGNTFEGSIVIEGKDKRRDGLFGVLTHLGTICTHALYVKDNHSFVASDFYVEQADNGYLFEGSSDDPVGRVTIQSPKMHMTIKPEFGNIPLEVRNYSGQIFLGPEQFYIEPLVEKCVLVGDRPVEVFIWASCFYKPSLDVSKSSTATVVTIGDILAGAPAGSAAPLDQASPEALKKLANALDDLRGLGAADLRVNFPRVSMPK
jgi:hypothetical protein